MSVQAQKPVVDESKLAMLLVRKKVITEGQLKAAMDYQRSLGGKITDVLVKLDLVRAAQIEEIARNPDAPDSPTQSAAPDCALDPGVVKVSELKVHRRLLDKLPADIVDRHLIVTFFPLPSSDSRKIVMGHGREITQEVTDKVRSIVGVDLYTLSLDAKVAKDFLVGELRHESQRKASAVAPRHDPTPFRLESVSGELLAHALANALIKRGAITLQDLEAELSADSKSKAKEPQKA